MGKKYRDLVRAHSTARGSERAVLNMLADYAGDDGIAYPGVDTIASNAGVSRRTAQRALQKLEDNGRVEVVAYPRGGHGCPTRYRVLIPEKGDTVTLLNSDNLTQEQCQSDQRTVSNATKNSVNLTSAYIEEPNIEPDKEPEGNRAPAPAAPPPVVRSSQPTRTQLRHTSPHLKAGDFADGYIPPGTGHNAVQVYYERFCINENSARLNAIQEDDLVRQCRDLDKLREVVTAYSRTNYRHGNVGLILDWYRDGIPSKHEPRKDAHHATRWQRSEPSSPEPEPTVSPEQEARYRAAAARIAAARAGKAA